jgi:CubicO group peptidase (beta-lactamase class C family)
VTKSMCGMALEILRESGEISSFDTPLRRYFPEWSGDERGSITIREVMDQTSGLDATEAVLRRLRRCG